MRKPIPKIPRTPPKEPYLKFTAKSGRAEPKVVETDFNPAVDPKYRKMVGEMVKRKKKT